MGDKRISTLETIGMKKGELDSICGGPPCQGYSKAGKQNVMDPRNSLIFEYMRFICELSPKTMVMEEVPEILNMVTPEGHPVIAKCVQILEGGGFGGHEVFQKAINAQVGSVGLLRGSKTRGELKRAESLKEKPADERPETDQLVMF